MNKHFLNEKGITLVELLAALVLFAIVSALVMTVLFNVFQNSENISDNAQLRQDANLLISTLRSNYNQGDFEVGLNDSKSLLIGGQEVNSSMTSSIADLELINGGNSISAVHDSMIVTADGTPLSIDLTLENEAGQTYSIFTTIEKPSELEIALLEVPDPPEQPPGGFTPPPTSDYCLSRTEDTGYAYHASNQFIPDGCVNPVTISANVHFSDAYSDVIDLKHNTTKFNVGGNLFVDPPQFNVDNKHPMKVGGDAVFKGRLELKDEAGFIATNIHAPNGDNNGKGIVVGNQTRLEAKESIVVAKTFYIDGKTFVDEHNTNIPSKDVLSEGEGHVIIGKNLIANTVEAKNDSIININGSASISNKLLAKDRSLIKIGKNLIIDGDLEMSGNVEIIVEGNAIIDRDLILGGTSKLTIKGNLTIKGDLIQDVNATLDVTGAITEL